MGLGRRSFEECYYDGEPFYPLEAAETRAELLKGYQEDEEEEDF